MAHDPDFEPQHAASPTAHIVDQLELYGHTPCGDEQTRATPPTTPASPRR